MPFAILALAAGVYLLMQVRIAGLGPMYRNLSWLVITLSLLCMLGGALHGIHHWRHRGEHRMGMRGMGMGRDGSCCRYMMNGPSCCMQGGSCQMGIGKDACCMGDSAMKGHMGCDMKGSGSMPACCMKGEAAKPSCCMKGMGKAAADSTAKK